MDAKEKRNAYMREYNKKNKTRINAQRKERYRKLKEEDPDEYQRRLKNSRRRDAKYYAAHKDDIIAKARANHWNYDPAQRVKIRKRHYKKHPARQVLRQRERMTMKNDLPFDLTEEWYNQLYQNGCAVTGIPFDEHGSDSPWVPHIDRLVPELGYTKANCRLVCACYNLAKKHWKHEDVLKMARNLIATSDA